MDTLEVAAIIIGGTILAAGIYAGTKRNNRLLSESKIKEKMFLDMDSDTQVRTRYIETKTKHDLF